MRKCKPKFPSLQSYKVGYFMVLSGCSCFLCNCTDWKSMPLKWKDLTISDDKKATVSDEKWKEIQKWFSKKYKICNAN